MVRRIRVDTSLMVLRLPAENLRRKCWYQSTISEALPGQIGRLTPHLVSSIWPRVMGDRVLYFSLSRCHFRAQYARIRALRLLRPPRIWLEILILKMCRLATIHFCSPLSPPASRDERLFLPKTAHINRIHLQFPRLVDLCLEGTMSSITHMDLNKCPIDFVMEFLLRCPNLIEFHSRSPFFPSQFQNPRSILKFPLVLSHLSVFTWSTNVIVLRDWGWYTVLYEHIHFPSLTRFNWAPGQLWREDHAALAFLSRFPKSVTTLQFGEVYSDIGGVTFSHFLPLANITSTSAFSL